MGDEKISVGVWGFGVTVDRVTTDGYKEPVPIEKRFEMISKVEGIKGVEIHYPTEFVDGDVEKTKNCLERYGFSCSNVMVDCYKSKWQNGHLTSYDDRTWRDAVDQCKGAVDAAVKLGCDQIGICPTHDGFDYPFQCDFKESYRRFTEGLKEIAEYNPKIKIGIEYKPRETRAYIITRSVDRVIWIADEIADNVGIILDVGHALFGKEYPAESAFVAMRKGKLCHLHLNDNHAIWDDDMTFGSLHFWDLLEFIVWLKQLGYDRWYSFDIYPYREDPIKACRENVENLRLMFDLAQRIDVYSILGKIREYRTPEISRQLRETLFKKQPGG